MTDTGFQIAPFRALRFAAEVAGRPEEWVAPPYDIIAPAEHRALLERSPWNIVRLTLGEQPGKKEDYAARAARLIDWKKRGVLREDDSPALWIYGCDYTVPGTSKRARFRGLATLGRLHAFEERVVLPHERTFPEHVDDRFHLLEATRAHLEPIFLLYEDPDETIDGVLDECSREDPELAVEARPGEVHALWPVRERAAIERLRESFRSQRPIIADGHHRYTTALQYREHVAGDPSRRPGSEWQPMVLGNLVGDGLSILATHRLVNCRGQADEALLILEQHLEPAGEDDWDYVVETVERTERFRIPEEIRESSSGAASSDYGVLESLVLESWLRPALSPDRALGVRFFKEGTGEREALERGEGDLLFRMRPVPAGQFRSVVEGGEVFPQKTTFFYPKLWSGLVLWSLEPVETDASGSTG